MEQKITRRAWAVIAGSAAAFGQAAVPGAAPAPTDDELRVARERLRQNAEQMAKVKLPMSTEPAVHFKA